MRRDLIPAQFTEVVSGYAAEGYASGEEWTQHLPSLVSDLLDEWELEPIAPSRHGVCAVTIPVRLLGGDGHAVAGADGEAVLKVTWPHLEAATEHLALQTWNGHGAVRLLRADPTRFALLLEPLLPRDLTHVEIDDACAIIGDLLAALRRPAHPRVPSLVDHAQRLAHELRVAAPAIPRRYLEQAADLSEELPRQRGTGSAEPRLLHTDLHYANVLAAHRVPWLAIDLKPMSGDPAFEVAPALWNRADDLGSGSAIRWSLRRRLEIICERAGIDPGRARAWTIVREADNALGVSRAARDPAGRDRVSLAVTIIKAMST